jgi:hypothetical protein
VRDLLVICAAACLVTAFAARPARSGNVSFENEKWTAIYHGDKMPDAPWFYSPNGNATAKVADGALLVSDLGKTNGERVLVNYMWRLSADDEFEVAANVKVKSCDGTAGNCILVANGINEELITFFTDKVALDHAKLTHAVDTTKDFRTYRIVVKGADIRLFVDEQMVIDGKGRFTEPAYNDRNILSFGGGSSPATAEAYWQYVAFKKTGVESESSKKGSIRVVDQQIIAKSDEDLNFPWARRISKNTIILAYSEGQHTVNEKGRHMVSKDNGKTWKPCPQSRVSMTLARVPDASSMTLAGTPGGSSIGIGGWMTKPIRGNNVHPLSVCHFTEDTLDKPEKWQAELEFPYNPGPHGLLIHRSLVRMPNGDLIGTGYGYSDDQPAAYHCYCIISHDQGRTWKYHSTIAGGKSPGREGFCEPVMLLLKNGNLLCHIRTGGPMMQVRSKDGGRTWSEPKQIADFGVDPDLIQLSNGAVVTSYGRPGVWLKVDLDGTGEEWDKTVEVYSGPGCSYTSLVELDPGLVALFYTESSFCGTQVGYFPINRVMVAYLKMEPRTDSK